MALPKEPRQKMINLMYLVLTALLALNVSSEILNAFKVIDISLRNSNANLSSANKTLYESLAEKAADPRTAEKAKIWQEKAEKARKLSDDINNYIENLKVELKKEADLNDKGEFKEDNLDAATRLFGTNGKGKELDDALKAYRIAMLEIDPSIRAKFEKTLPIDIAPPIGQDGKVKDFTTAYFHMTPTVAGLTMLSKFQNNIKNSENQVVTYCHEQIGAVKVVYNEFAPIVSTNATYLMPGDQLEIKAGVGAFNTDAKPQVIIQGSSVPVDGSGVGTWRQTVNSSGRINVIVKYTKPDGTIAEAPTTVDYTVGTPSSAAVMLDKMNVFYVGVDNPVTIGSPVGWDKTNVSMSGGSISGYGSKRTVRVSAVGNASITVTADGNSTSFPFRCKRIPNPVFKVGDGKIRMASVAFKSQQYCRAELENFDFDLRYSVVGATVYFSGANFSNVATASLGGNSLASLGGLMAKCGPGSVITFDNVKVSGPDGTRTIEGKSIALY
ncbi:MAG: gliding motility protein GldM [Chitinophagaceae bacterium]|nr:gliding motility protein GldM [Chitinophagaceae bacterium]